MKVLIKLAAITIIVFTTSVMAHSEGHGKVEKSKNKLTIGFKK